MSTRLFSAPITNQNPASENIALRPLGFVPQADGTVTVRWADPIDPANPSEILSVKNGAQYPGQIALIVDSDVDLLVYYGIPGEAPAHVGGGLSTGGGGGDTPPTFVAPLDPGTAAPATRIVPTGAQTADGAVAVVLATDQPEITVNAPERTRAKPGHPGGFLSSTAVGTSEALDVNPVALAPDAATAQGQTDTIAAVEGVDASVQEVRDHLPQEGGRLAVETELSAAGPLGTEATAAASAASLASLDAGIPNALGAGGGLKVEGVAGGQAVNVAVTGTPTINVGNFPATQAVTDNGGSLTTDTPQLPGALVGGRLDVNVGASALPTGAATSALQGGGLPAALVGGRLDVNVGASALPSGAATETTLGTRASEATAASTLAAVDTLEANTDQIETKLGTLAAQEATAVTAAASLAAIDAGTVAALGKQAIAASESVTQATGDTFVVDTELSATGALATEAKQGAGLPAALVGGRLDVNVGASALPTGAATSALQGGGLPAALVGGRLDVNVGASALPSGAATSANQTTTNASLSSIDAGTPNAVGPQAAGASMSITTPTTISRADGSTLATAATQHLLSAVPGRLRYFKVRYTGAGTKYVVVLDASTLTAANTAWTGEYIAVTNGGGQAYWEFPAGLPVANGVVLGIVATEPAAGSAITLSANAAENFTFTSFIFEPT